ncbi:hypothetical protein NU08_2168 [Flavobacterium anhuiense]|uniref:Uncharacterized protein n=1 Tax=Flavobacterium anhuiense TaxID=459526 RepID=A0A444VZE3_9FLAO|nr:hypothetical protein NU08_2168 [Flavobacterium anhuiense]
MSKNFTEYHNSDKNHEKIINTLVSNTCISAGTTSASQAAQGTASADCSTSGVY